MTWSHSSPFPPPIIIYKHKQLIGKIEKSPMARFPKLHIEPFKQLEGFRSSTNFIKPLLPKKRTEQPGGGWNFSLDRHAQFLGWTPLGAPTPPSGVPPPRQKGYQSAPLSNRYPSAYSSRPKTEVLQSYGTKTEIRTPMHTWPTRHP